MSEPNEQDQHEKVQAEIAKLIAETIALNKKTSPETEYLAAQSRKLNKEADWHAARIAAALLAAGTAFGVVMVKLIPLI